MPISPDNTNADQETRAHWVQLARKLRTPIRCILFTATAKLCEHNDTVRALSAQVEGVGLIISAHVHDELARVLHIVALQGLSSPASLNFFPTSTAAENRFLDEPRETRTITESGFYELRCAISGAIGERRLRRHHQERFCSTSSRIEGLIRLLPLGVFHR